MPRQPTSHQQRAPALGQAIGEEARQAIEVAAACSLQPWFGRIRKRGDPNTRGNDVRMPFELRQTARHRRPRHGAMAMARDVQRLARLQRHHARR